MSLSTIATLVGAHAKTAAAVLAVSAATGGGLAVATTVANSHAAPGLATAKAAPTVSASADPTESSDTTATDTSAVTPTSPTTSSTPVTCDNAKNHGAYVSSVAHATPTPSGTASPEPNAHGQAVSQAAQSSCGKPATAGSDSTDTTDSTDSTDTTDDQSGDSGKPTTLPSHPAHPKHSGHQPGH
jgi:hypothetical protein